MRIVITNDGPTAHFYIRNGFAKALAACGHDVRIWELGKKSAFDIFDSFEPDILVTQSYNVDVGMFKCLLERPWVRVTMKAGDWGIAQKDMDLGKYPILTASQREIDTVLELKRRTGKPDFVDIHYHQNSANLTHSYWADNGIKVVGLMSAADIMDYTGGTACSELECDLGFVGGYWGYKSQTLNKYLLPLCHPNHKYRIKIFGNQSWGVPQYCGFIHNDRVKDFFRSAAICPNISEPHSQVFGHDIVERPFKVLAAKGFMITDYVKSMHENVFGNTIVYAASPSEFKDKVNYYLKNPQERQHYVKLGYDLVINNHTYFHRAAQFFTELNLPQEAINCIKIYEQIKERMQLG